MCVSSDFKIQMSSRKRSRGESRSSGSATEDGKRRLFDGGDGCVTSVGFTPREVNIHVSGTFNCFVLCNVVETAQRRKKWALALRKEYRDEQKRRKRRK